MQNTSNHSVKDLCGSRARRAKLNPARPLTKPVTQQLIIQQHNVSRNGIVRTQLIHSIHDRIPRGYGGKGC